MYTAHQAYEITLLMPAFSLTVGENVYQCHYKAPEDI